MSVQHHPYISHHRALDVNEILSAILSYVLAQPLLTVSDAINPHWGPFHQVYGDTGQSPLPYRWRSRRSRPKKNHQASVYLVCRQWNHVARSLRRYIPFALYLGNKADEQLMGLEQLAICRGFACQFQASRGSVVNTKWRTVLQQLESMHTLHSGSTRHIHRSSPLREVFLSDVQAVTQQLVPFLSLPIVNYSITLLDISFYRKVHLDMTMLFDRPKDPDSELSSSSPILPYLKHLHIRHAVIAPLPEGWNLARPPQLCSFSLTFCSILESELAKLLMAFCGPSLRHLALKGLFRTESFYLWPKEITFSHLPQNIVDDLALCCSDLQSIEIADPKVIRGYKKAMAMLGKPRSIRVDTWKFNLEHDFAVHGQEAASSSTTTPSTLTDRIWLSTPVLTHLEIGDGLHRSSFDMHELWDFLCDVEQVEHLVSFKARGVSFDIGQLHPTCQPRWACRGLRTLEFRVGTWASDAVVNQGRSNGGGNTTPISINECSRRIFGFIALSFPHLTNLFLSSWMINVAETEGGFCFLSRLRHLQQITLQARHEELWGRGVVAEPLPGHGWNRFVHRLMQNWAVSREGKELWETMDLMRWIEREPPRNTAFMGRWSSLHYCKKIALLDKIEMNRAWWPPTTDCSVALRQGCLWENMQSITFNVVGGPQNESFINSIRRLEQVRSDISFQIQPVLSCDVIKQELFPNYL